MSPTRVAIIRRGMDFCDPFRGAGSAICRQTFWGELGGIVERNLATHVPARRRGGLPRPYVAVWVVLSSMALTYLAMLSVRPDLAHGLGDRVAALTGAEPRSGDGDAVSAVEIAALRQGLEGVQREMASLRGRIAGRAEQEQAIAARLTAIEAQRAAELSLPLATASIDRSAPEEKPATDALKGRAIEGQIVEAPRPSEPPSRRPPSEPDRVAFGAPQVKPAATPPESPRGIQIATGPSVDALRISWMLLAERHREILRKYEPRFVPSGSGGGPAYRLIAGPISSTSAANKVCGELRARRVTCGVSAFGGEPL